MSHRCICSGPCWLCLSIDCLPGRSAAVRPVVFGRADRNVGPPARLRARRHLDLAGWRAADLLRDVAGANAEQGTEPQPNIHVPADDIPRRTACRYPAAGRRAMRLPVKPLEPPRPLQVLPRADHGVERARRLFQRRCASERRGRMHHHRPTLPVVLAQNAVLLPVGFKPRRD